MDEPLHPRRTGTDPFDDPSPLPHDGSRAGFEHLGWTPGWRDHLQGVLAGTTPVRAAATGAVALVVVAVVAVVVLRSPAPPPPELTLPLAGGPGDPAATSTTTTSVAPAPAEVVVHAAGAVAAPGLYRLPAGSRVADALDAAGGPTGDADLDRVNLAAPVVDGERVFVPVPGEDPSPVVGGARPGAGPGPSPAGPVEPVDLNAATLEELDTLPGVGPATASAILAERDRRGRFASVEELLDVRGIGEAKLAALRELVRV